jgi:hypothetical protein
VHRFFYEQRFGKIPDGLVVRYKCDNRLCCNPEHLELGTPAENSQDMVERGRSAKGSRHRSAKLTEEDVREIRKKLDAGESLSHLARVYGVNAATISDIKR